MKMNTALPSEAVLVCFNIFPPADRIIISAQNGLNFRTDKTKARVDLCNELRSLVIQVPITAATTFMVARGCSWEDLVLQIKSSMESKLSIMELIMGPQYWRFYSYDKITKSPGGYLQIHLIFRHISEIELLASGLSTV